MTDHKKKTFSNDEDLPALPLPKLEDTLNKYLESLKPFLTDEEFDQSSRLVDNFKNSADSTQIQEFLEKRAKEKRNWLEEWWLEYGYLTSREPLLMGTNFTGIWSGHENPEPFQMRGERTQNRAMAMYLHQTLRFWLGLRYQLFPCNYDGKGAPFSMNQYRNLFNTARIPKQGQDEVKSWFTTATKEGDTCPNHIVINCKGRYFKLVPFESATVPFSVAKLEIYLDQLVEHVENNPASDEPIPIGAFTSGNRDVWAKARQEIIQLSSSNGEIVENLESSICIASLDSGAPTNDDEMFKFLLSAEDVGYRWADKGLTLISCANGLFGSQSEHTSLDGLVSGTLAGVGLMEAAKDKTDLDKAKSELPKTKFEFQELEIDFQAERENFSNLKLEIQREVDAKKADLKIELKKIKSFGKNDLKSVGVHPDTFVQIILQVAAYLTHGSPLATYETATTRAYFNGRTETLRSCTVEALELAKAVKNGSDPQTIGKRFQAAVLKHNQLMEEGKKNGGCDRHILGMSIAASILGLERPEFLQDPAFEKSGGNGNFALSTSLCGYTTITGGCAPMIKDGYGFFYAITPNVIEAWVLSHNSSEFSNPEGLWKNFEATATKFMDLLKLHAASSASRKQE